MSALVFWIAIGLVAYAYAGYPAITALVSRLRGRDVDTGADCPAVTVIVAAYNEEARIARRVQDLLAQDYPADRIRVLVVSDGSTDGTAQAADVGDARVRVLALPVNGGKAQAINAAVAAADTPLLCFTDARQQFAPGTLRSLVAPFADPRIGAVTGELIIRQVDGTAGSVGLYWRMEKRLRHDEARLGWLHGVTGAVYALRRELYTPMPAGTVLDDVWVPMHVLRAGRRVWMARDALAYDVASATAGEEFRRKLRTLAGNWQLIARLPWLLGPANPVALAWWSHKFARLLAPWALVVALVAAWSAPGTFYRMAFAAQVLAYALAGVALVWPRLAQRIPLMPAAGTFVMLNAAALLSLPASLAWNPSRLWKKH